MALLSEEIVGAFPSWAKSQSRYADLNLDNVVAVTLPQPIVVQTIRTGAIALGNLTLEFTRASGFYPDIVMGGPAPLQALRKLGAVEPQARFFSRNRGRALLVRKGNPLGIRALADIARTGARVAQADSLHQRLRQKIDNPRMKTFTYNHGGGEPNEAHVTGRDVFLKINHPLRKDQPIDIWEDSRKALCLGQVH